MNEKCWEQMKSDTPVELSIIQEWTTNADTKVYIVERLTQYLHTKYDAVFNHALSVS